MRDPADWILVMLALLVVLGTAGCADIRKLTMTKTELDFFSIKDQTPCIRGYDVCIEEGSHAR